MGQWTKVSANKHLKSIGSSLRLLEEPTLTKNRVATICRTHKHEYAPHLCNVIKGHGCPKCKTEKSLGRANHTVSKEEFLRRLHEVNPDARIVYYDEYTKPAKVRCLKCGMATTDTALNFARAPCQECKILNLESLKKDRTAAYRKEVIRRKTERQKAYQAVISERMHQSEHVTPLGEPYLAKKGYWKCKVECNYCTAVFHPRTENIRAGSKCKKCSMRWAKHKTMMLNGKEITVQGYEPQAIEYLVNVVHVKPKDIEVARVPRVKFPWKGRNRWYYPDAMVRDEIVIEVKSTMTLGLGGWWGKAEPPFEKNKAKHRAVNALGLKFKLIVVEKNKVVILPERWLSMTKEQVKAYIKKNARAQ